jgi:hypothetical protein
MSENFATDTADPAHWTQNSCFGAFRTDSLLHECRCKTDRTCAINAQVCWTKLRRNLSQRTHWIHSIGPKTNVLGRFGPFRYCRKVDAKLAGLVPLTHKFAKRGYVGIFCNERTRSTPLDPKLMFWGISDHFITAQILMQNWPNLRHYRTSLLNEVASKFSATNAPDPLHWTQNSCLAAFRTISLLHKSRCKTCWNGNINAQVR